ncbi:MAG: NAD-dependent epimerase/dehydratase family protein [Cyanobacteria bacterium P01_A01_bin.17]
MKIVITGAHGLLGWHLRCRLGADETFKDQLVPLDRPAFNDDQKLAAALTGATAVVHLAGVNRASEAEVETGNITIAKRLAEGLQAAKVTPHVLFANSVHKDQDNAYGRGKTTAHQILADWAKEHGAKYTELVLPHIFGECGRPFYNSVVFTFCHQLVQGEPLTVNADGRLELLHAQDICDRIAEVLKQGQTGELRLPGHKISVKAVADQLSAIHDSYSGDIIPDLRDRFELQLFNTLRSFMYPSFYPRGLKLNTDNRGSLFEAVKNQNGGQAFLSTTKPGITRGNHYHFTKIERFLVVRGQANICIRRLLDDHIETFKVSGEQPTYIDMPTLHTHNITNTGNDELMTLFWSHEIFDPEAPDTYYEPVSVEPSQS